MATPPKWTSLVAALRRADPVEEPASEPANGTADVAAAPVSAATNADAVLGPDPETSWPADEDVTRRSRAPLILAIVLGLLAAAWIGFAVWAAVLPAVPQRGLEIVLALAVTIVPPLLLLMVWASLSGRAEDPDRRWARFASSASLEAAASLDMLDGAEDRLMTAYAALERRARDAGMLAETGADALLTTARRLEVQVSGTESALRAAGASAEDTLALVRAIEDSAPQLDHRLSDLIQSLTACGNDLSARTSGFEAQLRSTSGAADDLVARLEQAHDTAQRQFTTLRSTSHDVGEDMGAMAEVASARVELMLDRARTVMATADEGLARQTRSLEQLSDRSEQGMARIDAMGPAVDSVSSRLVALEHAANAVQSHIGGHLASLDADIQRIDNGLARSNDGADRLLTRAEALLLAMDANIREIDDSLPASLARFEAKLAATGDQLGAASDVAGRMAGTAEAAARHLEQASETLTAQTRLIESTISAGDASLSRQTAEIAVMRSTLQDSVAQMAALTKQAVPDVLASVGILRTAADDAVRQAESAIAAIVARASEALTAAGGAALDSAVGDKVSAQIAQIGEIANDAVNAAQRATDHLMREMMSVASTAADLEGRMASAREVQDRYARDNLSDRAARIMAALNDSAIDVAKFLNQDVSQKEWTSYLAGDKSLFARRAARLLNGRDVKQVQTRYDIDEDFRDHVNRYLADFEAMLGEVLETRNGHALAIALLSSDLGRLYVALAQGTERLRA